MKDIPKGGKTPDDLTPPAPYIYRKYAQRPKQDSAAPPPPRPSSAPFASARPSAVPSKPPRTADFGIDEDAKTQELAVRKVFSLRSGAADTIPPPPFSSRRPSDPSGLGRATSPSHIPAAEPWGRFSRIRRLLGRLRQSALLSISRDAKTADWQTDHPGILDGINPRLLRAAAKSTENPAATSPFLENQDWRVEVARSSEGSSVSFLEASQLTTGSNFIRRRPSDGDMEGDHQKAGNKSYTKLSVRSFSSDVPAANPEQPLARGEFTYAVYTPPRITLKGALLRRDNVSTLILRGRAMHPLCVKDVMVFADNKKILYLSNASRSNAGYIEFSADIPLNERVSHVLVVARHNEEVMGSQSLFVKPSSIQGNPPAAAF